MRLGLRFIPEGPPGPKVIQAERSCRPKRPPGRKSFQAERAYRPDLQGQAGQVIVTSGDGTITISLDPTLGLGIATQNNLGTVKVPVDGGLEIDNQGNLKIAPVSEASSGVSDFATEVNLEVVKAIKVDDAGRVTEIKRELITLTGLTLGKGEDNVTRLTNDASSLAVAMGIVFGG